MKNFACCISMFFVSLNFVKSQSGNSFQSFKINNISSIDWRKFDYNQIVFFDTILNKHNLLVLSEEEHGDGSAYNAQCMILKGLIDSGKINAIYTESSWINIDKINSILKSGGRDSIFKTRQYMRSVELRYWDNTGFWDYLANKIIEGKVQLFGFDVDGASELIVQEMFKEAQLLPSVEGFTKTNKEDFNDVKLDYDGFDGWQPQSDYLEEGYLAQKKFIDVVINEYKKKGDVYRIKQWQSILSLFYWMYKRHFVFMGNKYSNQPKNELQESSFMEIRDSLMAANFLDVYLKNKKVKSVMLMASYHAMKNSIWVDGADVCCKDLSVKTMGDIVNEKIGNDMYNVCFISSSGERGIDYFDRKKPQSILSPKKNSLEAYLQKETNSQNCFVELKNQSFSMNAVFNRYFECSWSKVFSGVFFIREMKPLIFKDK